MYLEPSRYTWNLAIIVFVYGLCIAWSAVPSPLPLLSLSAYLSRYDFSDYNFSNHNSSNYIIELLWAKRIRTKE